MMQTTRTALKSSKSNGLSDWITICMMFAAVLAKVAISILRKKMEAVRRLELRQSKCMWDGYV